MIRLINENAFFIVISKPNGYSTHNEKPSLTDWLLEHNKPQHFVNRLDLQTSGLVVVAQKPEYQAELVQALHDQNQSAQKIYRAILRGPWKINETKCDWSWPLTDKAEGRQNPQGKTAERKECLTHVTLVRTTKYFSEVMCEIKTGRQHQIRKHAALAGHPLVGDDRYNDKKYNDRIKKIYPELRLCLHAEALKFTFRKNEYSFIDNSVQFENYMK